MLRRCPLSELTSMSSLVQRLKVHATLVRDDGVPSPLKKGSGEGAVPPHQKFFKNFLVQCVQKIFVFRPKGGHRPVPPPKYATVRILHTRMRAVPIKQKRRRGEV